MRIGTTLSMPGDLVGTEGLVERVLHFAGVEKKPLLPELSERWNNG